MAVIRLLPGYGYVVETGEATRFLPGYGYITETQAGAPSGTEVIPGPGSITITGYSPSILQPQGVNPSTGSVTFTGLPPVVTQSLNQDVLPSSGSIAITGYAPTLLQPHGVLPDVGNLAFTGYAPSVTQAITTIVTPGNGSVVVTGYAPNITFTNHQNVLPSTGGISFVGHEPGIEQTKHQTLAPSTGVMEFTGHAPSVVQEIAGLDPRYARPASVVSAGSWLPSAGASLSAMLDEPSADSNDYISTSSPSTCEVLLNPIIDPGTSTGHVSRYQVWSDEGNGLTVRLMQGATVIATWVHASLPLEPTIYAQALTPAECDSITNYNDLRLQFTAV